MPSWFDVPELPFKAGSPINESSVLEAVKIVHAIIDQEIAEGTNPENVFICGLSQGGALTLASVLLYPKTIGGGAVLIGWVPFTSSVISQFPQEAKKMIIDDDMKRQNSSRQTTEGGISQNKLCSAYRNLTSGHMIQS